MIEKKTSTKRTIRKNKQDKLSTKVSVLNDLKQMTDKHRGKDEELDKIFQEFLARTCAIVKQEVEKKSAEWSLTTNS